MTIIGAIALVSLLASQGANAQRASIEIWSTDPIALDIEWLRITEKGEQVVTARRKTAIGPPVPLEVEVGADRYVRFSYAGLSPHTYSSAELLAAKKLHVPEVRAGGEVVVLVPHRPVRPVQLILEGPYVRDMAIDTPQHVRFAGLPAGRYRVVPVFAGGIRGESTIVSVEPARSTVSVLPILPLGAVRISASADVCELVSQMKIERLMVREGETITSRTVRTLVSSWQQPKCDVTVGGLKPGEFEVVFQTADGSVLGATRFPIAAQSVTTAKVTGPPVIVAGRITWNGQPPSDAELSFSPRAAARSSGARPVKVKLDGNGQFAVVLDRPGPYMARLVTSHAEGVEGRAVTFEKGRNTFDWPVAGGTITVNIVNPPAAAAFDVTIRGGHGRVFAANLAAGEKSRAFGGLPFDDYQVAITRRDRAGMRPQVQPVTISAKTPNGEVTFNLAVQ